ncbi:MULTISPECIES: 2-hydroxyacid dehydrogenase [Leeuwenhoekiella]|jgi:D-lactate dehydrogenase|uniref:D-lactate dehydrogenase n=3 Tax=Leeuwenhoekiella TaxID=283735 RepID=A3XG39_LEEBM|nr:MULTISPECIES: 2-hydroxyacid dehydrogenase [Leeuwenhoekiella]EAQ50912.1 D-lactate dehydrogenase [Leeuwenhoekiella blandensis MED217]MAO42895.1 2-hydroxyacid dehydrogenase [Leeuwenhoekiella sp.]HCW65381.1 2-hydroxyacid dehydrogenase [Leeuwenhoekiella sp.]|tara:strand:+ start:25502 stop:26494 length:993 start_codon:yes stop_codon:yes gene_type:complete
MNIAFFSTKKYDQDFFDSTNTDFNHQLTFFETGLNEHTASLTKDFNAVCVFVNDDLNAATIDLLAKNGIQLIALRCAGFNNVDLKAAAEKNIKVVRVPAYSPQAVAEHAVALILTLNRKTHKAYNRVRENNFSLEKLTGFNLYGKTVGVIGTGIIGQCFAKIMLGFGCKVLAYDIKPNEELKSSGVEYVELEKLLKASDIISLHCPLNEHTHHLIDGNAFEKMKDGAMLINTGRGALIDTSAVVEALKSEKLGYLGIDVYEQESGLFFNDLSETVNKDDDFLRLMSFPNVLITGHQGFFTKEALEQIAQVTLQNLTDFENGAALENEVKA